MVAGLLTEREGIRLHPSAIAKMETRGAERPRTISLNEAAAIARLFGLSINEMFVASDDMLAELDNTATEAVHKLEDANHLLLNMVNHMLVTMEGLDAHDEVSPEVIRSIRRVHAMLLRLGNQMACVAGVYVNNWADLVEKWNTQVALPRLGEDTMPIPKRGYVGIQ